jgi:hypothetical protein
MTFNDWWENHYKPANPPYWHSEDFRKVAELAWEKANEEAFQTNAERAEEGLAKAVREATGQSRSAGGSVS